ARDNDELQAVEEVERVDGRHQLEAEQAAVAALEQRRRALVLRVTGQAGVVHAVDLRLRLEPARELQRVVAGALDAQGERLGAHRDAVRVFRAQRGAQVAQALLANLQQAPGGGRPLAIRREDVRGGR